MIHVAEPVLNGNERAYLNACITRNQLSAGYFVHELEEKFRAYLGVPEAVACTNGTSALHLALLALGIGPGDEVIVPDLTYVASANAVTYCGARAVLVDVDWQTWNLDPERVAEAITERTRAIMAVHLYGALCDMQAIADIAIAHDLYLVEDAAEAIGARAVDGTPAGRFGQAAAWSFYGNKIITSGEGGMVTFDVPLYARRARKYRGQGVAPEIGPYYHDVVGYNYRMTDLQAAVGLAQLERVQWHTQRRHEVAAWYHQALAEAPLQFQQALPGTASADWMVGVVWDNPAITPSDLAVCLAERRVETRPIFTPLDYLPMYRECAPQGCPNAHVIAGCGILLPTHANLTRDDVHTVGRALREVFGW